MQIFVISLKQSVKRRKYISEQLDKLGLSFSFFDAYLGTYYYNNPEYYDDKKAKKLIHRALKAGEVGCALSHNAVYKKISDEQIPYALILEDDAILSDDLPDLLNKIEQFIKNKNCIVNLQRCDVYNKKSIISIDDKYSMATPFFLREGSCAGAVGYIITSEAATKIKNINKPAFFPADHWYPYIRDIDYYGLLPTLTLIKPNLTFETTAQREKNIGFENNEKDFSKTEEADSFTATQLFKYSLKTFVPVTSHIYRFLLWCYRKTLKKIIKKIKK